jgi:hypothetical protein
MLAPNQYTDHLHRNDYLLKEGLNFWWFYDSAGQLHENPYVRLTGHGPSLSQGWMAEVFPFIRNELFAGSKGVNPLLVHSSIRQAFPQGAPSRYFDVGDFWSGLAGHPDYTDSWSEGLSSVAAHDQRYVMAITPQSSALKAVGTSRVQVTTVRAADTPVTTRATFNRRTVVFREADEQVLVTDASNRLDFVPGQTYRVAERGGAGGCSWTNYGFAHCSASCYAWGAVRLFAAPTLNAGEVIYTLRGAGSGQSLYLRTVQQPAAVLLRAVGSSDWIPQTGNWSYDATRSLMSYPDFPNGGVFELRLSGACP